MWASATLVAHAGPFSAGLDDPGNTYDAPVPGFVGPDGDGTSPEVSTDNYVNPLFFGWVQAATSYMPAAGVGTGWQHTPLALGPVTGDVLDVVSLGDLSADAIAIGTPAGRITLDFVTPVRNLSGADFVIFENGFASEGVAGVAGQIVGELAYVEVSSDGINFARFPSRSLTPSAVGPYGTIDPGNVFNLAGKHGNAYGQSWGTPFDLAQLAADTLVVGGQVNLNGIRYIRIVDIPGNGAFKDSQGAAIYDAWVTIGSGGFDLEAVGAISQNASFSTWAAQNNLSPNSASDDTDGDGLANLLEYAFAHRPTIPDNTAPSTVLSVVDGRLAITFQRDERAADLTYEVQASDSLGSWTTIARSQDGSPLTGVNGFAPEITETSASTISSVGVIRKVEVRDVAVLSSHPKRFMRVSIVKP